jgi:hypothetical protein
MAFWGPAHASVEAGPTTSVDLALQFESVTASVTVRGAVSLLYYDHHEIGGVARREQIDDIPLNGLNFLELAKVEPGVTSLVRGLTGGPPHVHCDAGCRRANDSTSRLHAGEG